MNEHVTLAVVGANVGLAGLSGAVHKFLANMSPILSFLLLLLQVAVAGLTAWFLFKKVKEVEHKQKYYERLAAKKKPRRKATSRRKRAVKKATAVLMVIATVFFFGGCMSPQVGGGSISTKLATQHQSQSPKDAATLATEYEQVETFTIPAGTAFSHAGADFVLKTNMPVSITTREKVDSSIGAADLTIGKMIAKLQSMRWIQMVGVVVMLFGVASMVYPPLRLIVASVTTSVVISAAGLGLIVLPILLVGQEVLILCGCLGAAGIYMFLHRYGKKSGENKILKRWVDANGNGKVDPGEIVGD